MTESQETENHVVVVHRSDHGPIVFSEGSCELVRILFENKPVNCAKRRCRPGNRSARLLSDRRALVGRNGQGQGQAGEQTHASRYR